jgi:glycerophosphoryl diester phosphodiesterase
MAQHRLIDRPLVDAVREAGGELYAWTVRDRATLERLSDLGVDAIVTGDPRLFRPTPSSATTAAAVAPGGGR